MIQHEHKNNGQTFLFVEVPEGASHYHLSRTGKTVIAVVRCEPQPPLHLSYYRRKFTLPSGKWSLLGLADELSDEQCAEMLHEHCNRDGCFYHWDDTVLYHAWFCHADTAIEYLLRSLSLPIERTIVLKQLNS